MTRQRQYNNNIINGGLDLCCTFQLTGKGIGIGIGMEIGIDWDRDRFPTFFSQHFLAILLRRFSCGGSGGGGGGGRRFCHNSSNTGSS